jgi:hypothetical protein
MLGRRGDEKKEEKRDEINGIKRPMISSLSNLTINERP